MKPEPLKKKDLVFIKEGDGKINYDGFYAIPLVKHNSAVEWLNELFEDNNRYNSEYIKCKIDEAFKNVTKRK